MAMAQNRRKNGIHWNGRVISRLSGPVSLSYLHPPKEHPEFPLVLLLGDVHDSNSLCDPCTAESNCMSVIESTFFDDLDELAREMPIDFFTETSWDHVPHTSEKQILFHHFVKKTQQCYNVSRRSVASGPCPTQFVRWHHVDTRLMKNTPYIEWHITNVMSFINVIYDISKSKPYGFNYTTYFAHTQSTPHWINIEIDYAREFIGRLFKPQQTTEELTQAIIELLFSYTENYTSIIHKELEKQSMITIQDIKEQFARLLFTSKEYKDAVEGFVSYLSLDKDLMYIFRDIFIGIFETRGAFYRYPLEKRTERIKRDIDIINDVIGFIHVIIMISTASLLDVYAVLRMIKKPQNNDRGILHIGYYGARHCDTIRDALVALLNYSIQGNYPLQDENNCVEINDPLYIESDMENLAVERYRKYPELQQEYKMVISHESRGRLEHLQGGRRLTRGCRKRTTRRKRTNRRKKRTLT